MLLILLCLVWSAGVIIGTLAYLPLWALGFCVPPILIILFRRSWWKPALISSLLIVLFTASAVYSHARTGRIAEISLDRFIQDGTIQIEGVVIEDPQVRDRTTTLIVEAKKALILHDEVNVSQRIQLRTTSFEKFEYGDYLQISGKIQSPREIYTLNYADYLESKDIGWVMDFPSVRVLEKGRGLTVISWIYGARNALFTSIGRAIPQPQSAIAQAILLGKTENIPYEIRQDFSRTNTSHILAISGMNLTLIMGILLGLGISIFGRRYFIYIWLSLIVIWFYTVFTGLQPPVTRAAIMITLFLLAELLGRQKHITVALLLAIAVMLGLEPLLYKNISFQLSVLSMFGLAHFYPLLKQKLDVHSPGKKKASLLQKTVHYLADGFLITLSAVLLTLPVIVFNFGSISLLGLPTTVFILPVVPFIILLSAITGCIGLVLPMLAQVTGYLDWLLISYYLFIVNIFSSIPFASVEVPDFKSWHIAIYYAVLFMVFLGMKNWNKVASSVPLSVDKAGKRLLSMKGYTGKLPAGLILLALLVMNLTVWTAVLSLPDEKLHVNFLDMGQGDATLIQTPDGKRILIDAGPSSQRLELKLGSFMPFWDRKLDLVILTQLQADHIYGLTGVLERYRVGQVAFSGQEIPDSATARLIFNKVQQKKIPVTQIHYPQRIYLDRDTFIDVIHPDANDIQSPVASPDSQNLVLKLTCKKVTFLFTSDIRSITELKLVHGRADLHSTVLKVAHHGSSTSSCDTFLHLVSPSAAVISCSADNPYGHPATETLTQLERYIDKQNIFKTSHQGDIFFISNGELLQVKTEKIR